MSDPFFKVINYSLLCRKRRKWDQPAEALVSAGIALPLGNAGALGAMSGAFVTNPLAAGSTAISPMLQQHATALVPKLNQVRYVNHC